MQLVFYNVRCVSLADVPRVVDAEERKGLIREAVIDIAAAEGFSAVTFRRVAARLATSTSAVTHYFPTRRELVAEAAGSALSHFAGLLSDATSDLAGVDAVVGFVMFAVRDGPDRLRGLWSSAIAEASRDEAVREALAEFSALWDAELEAVVVKAAVARSAGEKSLLVAAVDVVASGIVSLDAEGSALGPPRPRDEIHALTAFLVGAAVDATSARRSHGVAADAGAGHPR